MQLELAIQEVFLRFTASIFKDYKHHLNPITTKATSRATGAGSLFDMQGSYVIRYSNLVFSHEIGTTFIILELISLR